MDAEGRVSDLGTVKDAVFRGVCHYCSMSVYLSVEQGLVVWRDVIVTHLSWQSTKLLLVLDAVVVN